MSNKNAIYEMAQLLIHFTSDDKMQNLKSLSYQEYRLMIDNCDTFKEFSLDYPALFNMIIDDPKNFDLNRLKYMLGMKQKIDNNELSNEDATKEVGQKYYDEFVKNTVEDLNE